MKKAVFRIVFVLISGLAYLLIQEYADGLKKRASDPVMFRFSIKKYQRVSGVEPRMKAAKKKLDTYAGYSIHSVYLAGTFSRWSVRDRGLRLKKNRLGKWSIALQLKSGIHPYKFIVYLRKKGAAEKLLWIEDYAAGGFVPDGYGGRNSILRQVAAGRVNFLFSEDYYSRKLHELRSSRLSVTAPSVAIESVFIAGRFSDWRRQLKEYRMEPDGKDRWKLSMYLPPGRHPYKFVLKLKAPGEGKGKTVWCHDPDSEDYEEDGFGGKNSVLFIRTYSREIFFLSFVLLALMGGIVWFTILELVLRFMMRMRISLKSKLLFLFILLVLVSNLGFLLYSYNQKKAFARQIHLNMINTIHSFFLASGVDPAGFANPKNANLAGATLERFFRNTSLRQNYLYHSNTKQLLTAFFILHPDGGIIVYGLEQSRFLQFSAFISSREKERLQYFQAKSRAIVTDYRKKGKGFRALYSVRWSDYPNTDYPFDAAPDGANAAANRSRLRFFPFDTYLYPVYHGQTLVAYYLASFNAASISEIFAETFYFNLALVFAVAILSFLLVRRTGGFILEPLGRLLKGLDQVKEGNYDYDFSVRTGDEVEALGRSYQYMRSRLRISMEEIARHTEQLESTVDRRTHELKALNRQLRIAGKEKSRFFANMSHELRTPLTLILAPIEELLGEQCFTGQSRKHLEIIHRNSLRLLKLINGLLELSSIDSGRAEPSFRRTAIKELLGVYLTYMDSYAAVHGIRLILCGDEAELFMDTEWAETIFMNLLSNAVKFTPEGGSITITVSDREDRVAVSVADSGPGIPDGQEEVIFTRFMHGEHPRVHPGQGTGIGLHLVRTLVEKHGGAIRAFNAPEGGAVFELLFHKGMDHLRGGRIVDEPARRTPGRVAMPALLPFDAAELPDHKTEAVDTMSSGKTVLIVEDDSALRMILTDFLRSKYRILEAADGASGFKTALRKIPDLVLSDVMMPGMSGYELCRKMRQEESVRHIPVILLTARTGSRDMLEGLETGAVDYIFKPFRKSELLYKIETIFRLSGFRKALLEKEKLSTLGMLSGGLMHEIKNPIHYILGNLGPLERDIRMLGEANTEQMDHISKTLHHVREGAERINELVNGFKLFLHQGRAPVEQIDLLRLFEGIEAVLGSMVKDQVRIEYDFTNCSVVVSNRERLLQVFTNLLQNAFHAVGEGGRVRIRTELDGDRILVDVEDDGPGVPDENRGSIFDPFFTTAAVGEGIGLGLYLSRTIVEMLGGNLEYAISELGGALFRIVLPVNRV